MKSDILRHPCDYMKSDEEREIAYNAFSLCKSYGEVIYIHDQNLIIPHCLSRSMCPCELQCIRYPSSEDSSDEKRNALIKKWDKIHPERRSE